MDLKQDELQFHNPLHRKILAEAEAHLHDPNFTAERYFLAHPDPTISKLAADMINDRYQLSKSNSQAMVKDEERLHELVPHQLIDFKLAILEEDMKYTLQALNKPDVVANADKWADVYARWLRTDIRALKQEAKIMGHYLYEQGVTSRTYMFVPGTDRVAVLFEHRYKKYAKNGKLTFTNTRQELAEYSGLSVKTVNRAVKKFEEQGLISRSGKTFYIDEGQYEQLHALVSKLIEPLIERGRNDEPDL